MPAKPRPPFSKTKPYKTITIDVFPDFEPRITVPVMGGRLRGITSNLSLCGYIAFLFEINEYLPKKHKLTDFQLARLFATEFPSSKAMQRILNTFNRGVTEYKMDTIGYYRYRYNKGYLLTGKRGKRLGPISFKYNSSGDRQTFWGSSTKPLSDAEYQRTLERFGPDERRGQDFNWHVQVNHPVVKKKGRATYDSFDWCI